VKGVGSGLSSRCGFVLVCGKLKEHFFFFFFFLAGGEVKKFVWLSFGKATHE